jgi:DNA-binding transcriptional LysR family regulator
MTFLGWCNNAGMEIRSLRQFLAVAESLNYSRAAQVLNMAPSPLSRSIQHLERELGGALFSRTTRNVELTSLGLALLPHAEKVLNDLDVLDRAMRMHADGHSELSVGTRSVTPAMIRSMIEVVEAGAPAATVKIVPMESLAQIAEVRRGRLALGLVSHRVVDQRLSYLPVMSERPAMAMPDRPEYADLGEVSPGDIADLTFLIPPGFEPFDAETEAYCDAAKETLRLDMPIVGGLSVLIANGNACCLTQSDPCAPWHKYLAGEGVVIRPLPTRMGRGVTYLTWRVDRDNAQDLGPVLDVARARFEKPLEL